MTRTNREEGGTWRGSGNEAKRRMDISRSTTKLLRHQAQNEGVTISSQGWVKVNDLLAWKGFRDKRRFTPPVVLEDIFDIVEHDGKYGKGRFALRYVGEDEDTEKGHSVQAGEIDTAKLVDATANLQVNDQGSVDTALQETQTEESSSKNNPETIAILEQSSFRSNDPSNYMIRATQGHSIEAVESEGLHTLITLDDLSTIPDTVVHGTFHAAWGPIVASGGLKPMGRNMVHFATGPSLREVVPEATDDKSSEKKDGTDAVMNKNKVISGMRSDASILIYVDLKRCLEDIRAKGLKMEWFKSDNGVILTPGVVFEQSAPAEVDGGKQSRKQETETNLVPMEYWDTVVEINQGMGVIWRHGEGVVRELPAHLKAKPLPRGKQGSHKGQQRGGKPSLKVEKNAVEVENAS